MNIYIYEKKTIRQKQLKQHAKSKTLKIAGDDKNEEAEASNITLKVTYTPGKIMVPAATAREH